MPLQPNEFEDWLLDWLDGIDPRSWSSGIDLLTACFAAMRDFLEERDVTDDEYLAIAARYLDHF